MRIENQTQEVLASLYNATRMFTEQLQPHYYKQFHGDVMDLASDLYMKFTEPRGVEEKTLLDRYDCEWVNGYNARHWNAYIRTAVMRALIDESRTHPWSVASIDAMLDEFGDSERLNDAMEVEPSIDNYDYDGMKSTMESKIRRMTPKQFQTIKNKYLSVRSVLDSACVKVMDVVMNPRIVVSTTVGMLPVYRVQNGEALVAYKGKLEGFDVMTGRPVHSIGIELTPSGMGYIGKFTKYKVDSKKSDFLKSLR